MSYFGLEYTNNKWSLSEGVIFQEKLRAQSKSIPLITIFWSYYREKNQRIQEGALSDKERKPSLFGWIGSEEASYPRVIGMSCLLMLSGMPNWIAHFKAMKLRKLKTCFHRWTCASNKNPFLLGRRWLDSFFFFLVTFPLSNLKWHVTTYERKVNFS